MVFLPSTEPPLLPMTFSAAAAAACTSSISPTSIRADATWNLAPPPVPLNFAQQNQPGRKRRDWDGERVRRMEHEEESRGGAANRRKRKRWGDDDDESEAAEARGERRAGEA